MPVICPHCQSPIEGVEPSSTTEAIVCPSCGSSFQLDLGSTTGWNPTEEQRRLGKFELIDPVGSGTFGTVYKARDPDLDRVVAIKVPRAGHLPDGADRDRFLREARSVAQLRHPSIVPVYEVGQHEGVPFLVSEFVHGVTLADRLTARRPDFREAARIIAAVADALQYAHDRGVVHRDVKPSNIILSEDGTPHLMDFGLARRDGGEATMTAEGQVLGTPAYMSPEQARGESHRVDGRSDIYSLGVILYQLLTGELPFRGNARMLLHQVLHDDPRGLRSLNDRIPRDLETICLTAMAKEPGHRYARAADLAADLRRFLNGEPILARPVGRLQRGWRWCRRNPVVAGLSAAVALLLLTAAVISTVAAVRIGRARDRAEQSAAQAHDALGQAEAALARETQAHREADQAKERADFQRRAAESERARAETTLYYNRLALAERYWSGNRVDLADRILDECPPELHHWEWHYLKRLCHAELETLPGITCAAGQRMAFSADGTRLATIYATSRLEQLFLEQLFPSAPKLWGVRVWDTNRGQQILDLGTESFKPIQAVALSPDGGRLATAVRGVVTVWDAQTEEKQHTFSGQAPAWQGLAFSPDGRLLAGAGADGAVTVWDLSAGREWCTFRAHPQKVNGVAFRPDGRGLATAGGEGRFKAWTLPADPEAKPMEPRERYSVAGHEGQVVQVAFSPDGTRLASVGDDNTVKIWEAETGKLVSACTGHTGPVNGLAFSPDGERLATASQDLSLKVWDPRTGRELFTLRGHDGPVQAVAYRPGGKQLISAGEDQEIKVWDALTGLQAVRLAGRADRLAFSPDGRHLATLSGEGKVTVWNTRTGEPGTVLSGPEGRVCYVSFTPDGRQLTTLEEPTGKNAEVSLHVRLWEVAGGRMAREWTDAVTSKLRKPLTGPLRTAVSPDGRRVALVTWEGQGVTVGEVTTGTTHHPRPQLIKTVECLAFSPDGRQLALAGPGQFQQWGFANYVVEVWDCTRHHSRLILTGCKGPVLSLVFRADGRHLAAGGVDRTVTIWDVQLPDHEGRAEPRRPLLTLAGHSQPVRGIAFSPGGDRLASISANDARTRGEVKLWDLPSGQEVLTLAEPGVDIAFSPKDGFRLALAGADAVKVWNGTPSRELLTRREAGQSVAFSPDGRLLALAGQDDTITLLDKARGWRLLRTCAGRAGGNPEGPTQPVRRAVFSPDGRLLASAADDGTVKIWDVETGRVRCTCTGHAEEVVAVAFSPDGTRLVSTGADETARVWSVSTGQEILTFSGHGDRVQCVAFSPDGRHVASGGDDKTVRLWDADTGRELFPALVHGDAVNSVAFSPDGRWLATGGEDHLLKLWDAHTGKEVRSLVGHQDGIRDLAFSPDGTRLASAGWDRVVKVWETATGKELLTLHGHDKGVCSVSFGPDGWLLASAGADMTLRLWNTRPEPAGDTP